VMPTLRIANHVVGAVDCAATAGRVLFCVPKHVPPALEIVAFPGDGVPCPAWTSLAGVAGHHPHAGGLLGELHERLRREGGEFSRAAVFVIEPSRIVDIGYAVYDRFFKVALTACGEPATGYHGAEPVAASNVAAALDAAWARASQLDVAAKRPPASTPLQVFGFSKGGIVCNQLLAELSAAPPPLATEGDAERMPPSSANAVLQRLRDIHFLDAGLPCRGAHVTDPKIVDALGRRAHSPTVWLHGTPRQWNDPGRRWLVEEKDRCAAMLAAAGVHVVQVAYYEGDPPSLEQHFRVVSDFRLAEVVTRETRREMS